MEKLRKKWHCLFRQRNQSKSGDRHKVIDQNGHDVGANHLFMLVGYLIYSRHCFMQWDLQVSKTKHCPQEAAVTELLGGGI